MNFHTKNFNQGSTDRALTRVFRERERETIHLCLLNKQYNHLLFFLQTFDFSRKLGRFGGKGNASTNEKTGSLEKGSSDHPLQ